MVDLLVHERDQKFVLFEQLDIGKLSESELYSEFDVDIYNMVLNEAKKLSENAIMPTNKQGDEEGAVFKDGKVHVPASFHELWRLWNEGEWRRLDIPREYGGQGMPMVVGMAANEYAEAGNLAFQTLAAMTRGAALLIATHGSEEQKKKYVEKILSGQWTGTMDLTEAGAGSDVGATKTVAERNPDGTYSITGSKVFITGGNTDLTKNIIHLALARVKGASPGTKGLSLFLIPAYKINPDGSPGESNDVKTIAVEKKLGIKGSPTCQLSLGEDGNCIGELVGEENRGMPIFFTMMNESRLIAARHGAAVASAAYLHALVYARERLQGTVIGSPPGSPQCPIIRHPDVRRMLLQMKAYTEGVRALILYTSYCIDQQRIVLSDDQKNEWEKRIGFLTPVTKAYGSDLSFRVTETAMQVYGGYGYMKDYPIEQFLRDEKVHSIFEGTNGIQALDLAGRKLGMDFESLMNGHMEDIKTFWQANKKHETLSPYVKILEEAWKALADVSEFLVKHRKKDFHLLALSAYPYLELFGDVTVGWLLLWQALIAQERLNDLVDENKISGTKGLDTLVAGNANAAFYSGKLASARFFISQVVGLATAKARVIKGSERAALEIAENAF
ncbi:MAG: acyl-CoA dehydrogenase [Deltaproteobacteria bacterium]|nr:acyl-CoA dehydrogenase [Deltaproteobacteria bacterium]